MDAPNPILPGARTYLRPFESNDLDPVWRLFRHPELTGRRYLPWRYSPVLPLSRAQADGILNEWNEGRERIHLAVIRAEDTALIGYAAMFWGWDPHCPNLSLVIDPEHQRQGFGTEVVQIMLCHLFENTVAHNVSGWLSDWNQPAGRYE